MMAGKVYDRDMAGSLEAAGFGERRGCGGEVRGCMSERLERRDDGNRKLARPAAVGESRDSRAKKVWEFAAFVASHVFLFPLSSQASQLL